MMINIDYTVPERCEDCKFLKEGSSNFGRTYIFVCSLTGIGDNTAEGYADQNRAEKRMKEKCPFK